MMLCTALAGLPASESAAVAPFGGVQIAVIVNDLRNPFFVTIARTVEARSRQWLGHKAQVSVESSGFDHARQLQQMQRQVDRRVQLVILTPIEPELIAPMIARAHAAGIKVVAVDAVANGADLTITTDNHAAGDMACAYLGDRLPAGGNVAIINGPPNSAVSDRVRGCREALARYPRLRLVSEMFDGGASREGGLERMAALLDGHAHLDGVFTINDPTAIGAEIAARQSRRAEMIITTVDGSPEIERRLRDPGSLIAASAAQAPAEMARMAVDQGLALLRGRTVSKQLVMFPPRLVTRDNITAYRGWNDERVHDDSLR